jgi:hypothetical protein
MEGKMEELFNKWIAALRSGEYSQDRGALRTDDGFCCLGVLCDVMGAEWEYSREDGYFANLPDMEPSDSYLPGPIFPGLGSTGVIEGVGDEYDVDVALANDEGKSFETIANILEQHRDVILHPYQPVTE